MKTQRPSTAIGGATGATRAPAHQAFELTGGRLCLDLANTLDRRRTSEPLELLTDYGRLIDWGTQAGAVTHGEGRALRRAAIEQPSAGLSAVRRAREAREVIFDLFSALAARRPPERTAMRRLADIIAEASARRRLVLRAGGFAWVWPTTSAPDLTRVLWPAVWSAAELLMSAERRRVRECAGAGCAWLFIDTSRNASRRWCDMTVCGNRAKAARFRENARRRA